MATNRSFAQGPDVDTVAGNGLLHRRMFLMAGTAVAASVASTALPDSAAAEPGSFIQGSTGKAATANRRNTKRRLLGRGTPPQARQGPARHARRTIC
jgi:hypothetical protein